MNNPLSTRGFLTIMIERTGDKSPIPPALMNAGQLAALLDELETLRKEVRPENKQSVSNPVVA